MVECLKKVLFSFLIYISFPAVLVSQEKLKTNEEVFKELTQQVLESFLETIDINLDDTIILRKQVDSKTQFIDEFIIGYLKNSKQYNLSIHDENYNDGKILEYFVNKLEISYSKPFREKLLGEKKFVRNFCMEIAFKFIKNSNLMNYKSIPALFRDTVEYIYAKRIENEMIPVTIAKFPDDEILEKYIAPIITITTVSVIVYLFFIIRK